MSRPTLPAGAPFGAVLALLLLTGCENTNTTPKDIVVRVQEEAFGQTGEGTPVRLFTLTHANGTRLRICEYGAIVVSLEVPDREGNVENIVLGFDDLDGYLAGHPYFGAIVGRVANRIANGRFSLEGKTYQLATNNGPHHLHGGEVGFDKRVWTGSRTSREDGLGVEFRLTSEDGDEGYPGKVDVVAAYILTRTGELRIEYRATADAPTPVNLTHHSYFNLAGPGSGTVRNHVLEIAASQYTEADETLAPTGAILPVAGTPFDFRSPMLMGARLDSVAGGYDLNYVLDGPAGELRMAARVTEPTTGRVLEILTTKPGLQFYTGNFLDGVKGASGKSYDQHGGFCLEPQHFPDSVHHPEFPDTILRPGEEYRHTTVFRFATR